MEALQFRQNFYVTKGIAYLLIALFSLSVMAQEAKVIHKKFGKEDGLELDIITDVVFDNDGFLWLGGSILDTRDIIKSDKVLSLQRFNGKTFHNITIPSIFDVNFIEKFHKREDGTFIIRSKNNKFLHFNPFTTHFKAIQIKSEMVSPIYTFNGVDYFLGQTGRNITLYVLEKDLTTKALFSFTSSENKYALENSTRIIRLEEHWLITDKTFAIKVFEEDGTFVKEIKADSNKKLDNNARILWIDEVFKVGDTTAVVFYGNATLHYIDEEKLDIFPLELLNNQLFANNIDFIKDDRGNSLLMSEYKGVLQFSSISKDSGINTWYSQQQFEGKTALHPISLNVEDDVWIASSNGELHYYKFPKKNITQILPETQFRAISYLKDDIYLIATEGDGWHLLDLKKITTEKVTFNKKASIDFPNSSRNFIKDENIIWSNGGSGIVGVDLATKDFEYFSYYPVTSLERINDSVLICGTNKFNLLSFNIRNKSYEELVKTDTLHMHDVAYSKKNNLLIAATSEGLFTYQTITKKQAFYNSPDQLEDTYLLMADYHPEHGFIVGTRSGHIVAFNEETKSFKTIYKDALGAGIATVLIRDDIWWINTFNGYVRWNSIDNTAARFSSKDGFSNNEANRYSALDTKDGFLIGTIAGLNYFDPETLMPAKNKSSLKLLKIRSYNTKAKKIVDEYNQSVFSENPSITLPAEFKELQIEYALTNNVANSLHSFQYRLNTEDWIQLQQEQQIRFPNMAAGNYKLQIEALDFSGKKIGEGLQIAIVSKNFFYRTWWFYFLVIIALIVLLLYLLDKAREKQRLQEKFALDLLLSQEKERNHIARELHDSVGQQLTLIKKKTQQKGDDDLTGLTNTVLEEVRAISRGLYPANLKLLGLTQSIEQLIYDLDEQFDTFFSVDVAQVDAYFNEAESLNLYRFVQECITNSMKHSSAGAISVEVIEKPSEIAIEITDNGKGFEVSQAQLKNSLGLKTLAERIKIIGGTLSIKSTHKKGTTITALIPKK